MIKYHCLDQQTNGMMISLHIGFRMCNVVKSYTPQTQCNQELADLQENYVSKYSKWL